MSSNTLEANRIEATNLTDAHVGKVMRDWGGTSFRRNTSGGINEIVIVTDASLPYVVKRARTPDRFSRFTRTEITDYEAGILQLILPHRNTAPVNVPELLNIDDTFPKFVIAQYVPGFTLTDEQVGNMEIPEKQKLGRRLAQFVVWMSDAILINDRFITDGKRIPYDKRAAFVNDADMVAFDLDEIGQYTLATVLVDLYQEYLGLKRDRRIKKRDIVGHNDLRPANWTFKNDAKGNFELAGVIDFGETIATTVEQEFRRTPRLGDTVLISAIEEYKRITGVEPDIELVRFWDKVHVVNFAVNSALKGFPGTTRQNLSSQLLRLYPENNWMEITEE